MSAFLGLQELSSETAEVILAAIARAMDAFKLKIQKLIGIGTDNASVIVSHNNGLFTWLKNKINLPHLVLISCVFHSLQLDLEL